MPVRFVEGSRDRRITSLQASLAYTFDFLGTQMPFLSGPVKQQTVPANTHASRSRDADRLTADLHLSLLSSKPKSQSHPWFYHRTPAAAFHHPSSLALPHRFSSPSTPSLNSMLYPSLQIQQTLPETHRPPHTRALGSLTADVTSPSFLPNPVPLSHP